MAPLVVAGSLALALRELGRVERTLFTLEWLQSPELRRRVQVDLNKGEAKNALARTVFFNRLGELRDRTFENQRYRTSGLHLLVAAIVLWNRLPGTRYQRAARGWSVGQGFAPDTFIALGLAAHQSYRRLCLAPRRAFTSVHGTARA
jgi:hypothetical protein